MHRAMRVLDRVRDPGRGRDVGPGSQVAEEGERGPQPVPEGGRRLNLPPRQNRKGRGGNSRREKRKRLNREEGRKTELKQKRKREGRETERK